MKALLGAIFFLVYSGLYAQKYNTDIGKANKVEVKEGITNIKKADKVIVEIYNDVKSKLFVNGYNQITDSSGIYITTIHLINPYSKVYEIDLQILLDKSATDVSISGGVGAMNKEWTANKEYWVFSGTVRSDNGLRAIIKSKEKIVVSMKGVQGVLKN